MIFLGPIFIQSSFAFLFRPFDQAGAMFDKIIHRNTHATGCLNRFNLDLDDLAGAGNGGEMGQHLGPVGFSRADGMAFAVNPED